MSNMLILSGTLVSSMLMAIKINVGLRLTRKYPNLSIRTRRMKPWSSILEWNIIQKMLRMKLSRPTHYKCFICRYKWKIYIEKFSMLKTFSTFVLDKKRHFEWGHILPCRKGCFTSNQAAELLKVNLLEKFFKKEQKFSFHFLRQMFAISQLIQSIMILLIVLWWMKRLNCQKGKKSLYLANLIQNFTKKYLSNFCKISISSITCRLYES